MKILLLLLLPTLGWAQAPLKVQAEPDSDGYLFGTYTLSADSSRHEGFLITSPQRLVVRVLKGKNLKYTPADVSQFNLGDKRYFTLRGMVLPGPRSLQELATGTAHAEPVFVQQLDSGQVILVQYSYTRYSPGGMSINGNMVGGGSYEVAFYLLRRADNPEFTLVKGNNKYFRELIRPYLTSRPDLLKYLDEKRLTISTLPDLIHSLNTGVSYLPPERFPRAEE